MISKGLKLPVFYTISKYLGCLRSLIIISFSEINRTIKTILLVQIVENMYDSSFIE